MILLSQKAGSELMRIAADSPTIGKLIVVRVGVKGGGCSGFSYTFGFDGPEIREDDMIFDHGPIRIVCDPKSFLYLNGIEIDFEESLMSRGFKFKNPNARGSCGCGESFNV